LTLPLVADDKTPPKNSALPTKASPAWIWLGDKPKDKQTVYFRKEFEVASPVAAVTLQATCDNALTLYIDGKKVLEHSEWESPAVRDVTKHFVNPSNKTGAGKHVVAVQAHNSEGPAGLLVRLVFEGKDKKLFTVVT